MAEDSKFSESLKDPVVWIIAAFILFLLASAALGPINGGGERKTPENNAVQVSRTIVIAMFQYSTDHNGKYPSGKSSTEVFQKLIDEQYTSDSTIFWNSSIPGKIEPTTNKLKPENVCWDVTIPADANSSDELPMVFLTGYRINYVPGGSAVPLFPASDKRFPGTAVAYHGNNAAFVKNDGLPDGIITNFISTAFDPKGVKYQQLKPDGPLP